MTGTTRPTDLLGLGRTMTADLLSHAGRAGPVTAALMAAGALVEGLGIALVLPMLAALTHQGHGRLEGAVDRAFRIAEVESPMGRLALVLLAFTLLMIVRAAVLTARDRAVTSLQQGFVEAEQIRLVTSLGGARWQDLVRLHHSRVVHALTVEIARVSAAITVLLQAAVAAALLIAQTVMAALIAPRMTGIAALVAVMALPVWLAVLRRELRVGQALSTDTLSLTDRAAKMLGGLKTAIAQNMQAAFISSFADTSRAMARKAVAHRARQSRSTITFTTAAALGGAILAFGGAWLGVEPVRIIVALFVFSRMSGQLRALQQNMRQFAAFLPSYATLRALQGDLVAGATTHDASIGTSFVRPHAAIVFDGVGYAYPDADGAGVRAISLSIAPGEAIGITGHSGSGKTTFVDLLAGMMEPDTGTIMIGEVRLDAGTARSWRDAISYVPQEAYLFDDTVRANLIWGVGAIGDAEVWRMLEIARVADAVRRAPSGLDARMGERGVRFSGGERQRLAIARALLRCPALLILDEATSALDLATEEQILSELRTMAGRPTMCVVSHRPETLRQCERLVRFDAGAVLPG